MAARPLIRTSLGYPFIIMSMISLAATRFRRLSALTIFALVLIRPVHAEPTVRFLSKAGVISVLTKGPGNDYYQRMQIPEIRAKTGLPLQGVSLGAAREQARAAYGAAAEEFTIAEQAVIRAEIETLQPILQSWAPRYARMPWCFIKVTSNIEGGMSYTFGDCIILPDRVVARFVRLLSSGTAIERASVDNILVHEQTHVLQRRDPALFAEFYLAALITGSGKLNPTHELWDKTSAWADKALR